MIISVTGSAISMISSFSNGERLGGDGYRLEIFDETDVVEIGGADLDSGSGNFGEEDRCDRGVEHVDSRLIGDFDFDVWINDWRDWGRFGLNGFVDLFKIKPGKNAGAN